MKRAYSLSEVVASAAVTPLLGFIAASAFSDGTFAGEDGFWSGFSAALWTLFLLGILVFLATALARWVSAHFGAHDAELEEDDWHRIAKGEFEGRGTLG